MGIKNVIWFVAISFSILSLGALLVAINDPIFKLNENQILYIYSTSAQVLAGIYGLTLSGFIFFRNELSREQFEDSSLSDAIKRLKKRYFHLLGVVTFCTFLTLGLSNLVIAMEGYKSNNFAFVALLNISQSAYFTSLGIIVYFIFQVIEPRKIEMMSQQIKEELDSTKSAVKGSLEDFLSSFNQMEVILSSYCDRYNLYSRASLNTQNRMSVSRALDFLLRDAVIDNDLCKRAKDLTSLRNSLIHGAELEVSEKMVKESQDVLRQLNIALKKRS
ncbi:hypothetical protein [Photobacterium angustum]|uniref:hypothetical protein n=1 Tax=Photobacterium angustum TaxID=661 RepID=UPI0005E23602|nr:hypothetical protein [Photobacterium angustum]KJF96040.1 hypothetical protein UB39_03885 [Photobacterium angustum]PSW78667.1 hypothetical protein CTN03_18515 [Photobacterium angustum]